MQALYLGITCREPSPELISVVPRDRDCGGVFGDEAVEVFLDPGHSHARYHQLAFNAAGSLYDSLGMDPGWDSPGLRAAAWVGAEGWSLEVLVPWADLGISPQPGQLHGFNVCRDRLVTGKTEWMNWARVMGG